MKRANVIATSARLAALIAKRSSLAAEIGRTNSAADGAEFDKRAGRRNPNIARLPALRRAEERANLAYDANIEAIAEFDPANLADVVAKLGVYLEECGKLSWRSAAAGLANQYDRLLLDSFAALTRMVHSAPAPHSKPRPLGLLRRRQKDGAGRRNHRAAG